MDGTGRPDLVIFDCDGVLIDSEPISLARLTDNLNRIGVPIDLDTVARRFTGTSMTSIMAHIAQDYGVATPEGFVEEVRADTLRAFERENQARVGAELAGTHGEGADITLGQRLAWLHRDAVGAGLDAVRVAP